MGSLFGRARFSTDVKPPLASSDLHWLPVLGKKQVPFMVGKGGQVASIRYREKQGLAKAPFCTLPSVGKMLLTKLWSPHEAAQAPVVHKVVLLLHRGLPF